MPCFLSIHCPPGIPTKDAKRLGRIARMPGFSAINRVLGWVVLAGQFTAINVVLPWVFLPLFMFSDILVVRVIAGVLSGLVLWSAYRLVANGVRMVARHRVLDLRPFVWAAALVLMLVISALVAVEV